MPEQLSFFPEVTKHVSDLKYCRKCDSYKARNKFSNMTTAGDGKHPYCKDCMKYYSVVLNSLRRSNKVPEDHVCPVCNRSEDQIVYNGKYMKSVWRIDHCHETNEFRGWLCITCNQALGMFHDNPEILKRAIAYLQNGSS